MLIQELFQRAAGRGGPVTQAIAATLAPAILRLYAATMALGGSGRRPTAQALNLPPDVVEIVPAYRGYKYVVVKDEILILEPSTLRIVAIIDA